MSRKGLILLSHQLYRELCATHATTTLSEEHARRIFCLSCLPNLCILIFSQDMVVSGAYAVAVS